MTEKNMEIANIEEKIAEAIRAATYNPDADIKSSDSLINDLGIDSLEMQVLFQTLSEEFSISMKMRGIMEIINKAVDSNADNGNEMLAEISSQSGLSFEENSVAGFVERNSSEKHRNLIAQDILSYVTVRSVADCIVFTRGKLDG